MTTNPTLAHMADHVCSMMTDQGKLRLRTYADRLLRATDTSPAATSAIGKAAAEWAKNNADTSQSKPDDRLMDLFLTCLDAYEAAVL